MRNPSIFYFLLTSRAFRWIWRNTRASGKQANASKPDCIFRSQGKTICYCNRDDCTKESQTSIRHDRYYNSLLLRSTISWMQSLSSWNWNWKHNWIKVTIGKRPYFRNQFSISFWFLVSWVNRVDFNGSTLPGSYTVVLLQIFLMVPKPNPKKRRACVCVWLSFCCFPYWINELDDPPPPLWISDWNPIYLKVVPSPWHVVWYNRHIAKNIL